MITKWTFLQIRTMKTPIEETQPEIVPSRKNLKNYLRQFRH